jgi:AraC-like DNA-binding protein
MVASVADGGRAVGRGPASVHGWKPAIAGVREVFHARFADHAYPPHTHDAWTLFIVDEGAIAYDLDRRGHGATPSMVTVLPPHVVHDGRPASSAGFGMRVLYLEPEVLGEDRIGRAVDRPVLEVAGLRRRISELHDTLACRDDALEAGTRLSFIVDAVRATLGPPGADAGDATRGVSAAPSELAERARAHLAEHLFEPVTIADLAAALDDAPSRIARAFATTFGIAPHAWVVGRRLEEARDRILGGAAVADVAAEVGFVDQAHLTRRFRQYFGTTPAAIRRVPPSPMVRRAG